MITFSGIASAAITAAAAITEQKIREDQARRAKAFLNQVAKNNYPKPDALCGSWNHRRADYCFACNGTNRDPIPWREVMS